MMKILTAAAKELLLLKRDRTGLLVLFIMPAILVVVITLVQENVMELTGQKKTRMLFLDQDKGDLGRSLQKYLEKGHMEVVAWDERQKNVTDIHAAVADGTYQVGIVVPEGSTTALQEEAARLFQKSDQQEKGSAMALIPVHVFFDPGIMPGLRSGITAQLQTALQLLAMETQVKILDRILTRSMGRPRRFSGTYAIAGIKPLRYFSAILFLPWRTAGPPLAEQPHIIRSSKTYRPGHCLVCFLLPYPLPELSCRNVNPASGFA